MTLKCKFEIVDMGDEVVAVPVGNCADKVQGVLKMNQEGAEIFSFLMQGKDKDGIIEELSNKYDNDVTSLKRYVDSIVLYLQQSQLIDA